jgi:hypothetical protein
LYRPKRPVQIDGVIAVDQYAARALVDALGPITLPGESEPVTGKTFLNYVHRAWAPDDGQLTGKWFQQRKSFMGPLAEAAWQRVEQGQVEWSQLAQTALQLLDQKHVLVYLAQSEAAAVLAARGWDGALRYEGGDAWLVIDSNLGYNKASARVRETLTYEIDLRAVPPQASLTVVYTHTGRANIACSPESRYDPTYEQMMDRCYWDYVRVYLPPGSQVQDVTRINVPGASLWRKQAETAQPITRPAEEKPWLVWSAMNLVPTATARVITLTWTLPADVVRWNGNEGEYALQALKQAGTVAHPLTVRVRPPEGAHVLGATPTPDPTSAEWLTFRTTLATDRKFWIRFAWQPRS